MRKMIFGNLSSNVFSRPQTRPEEGSHTKNYLHWHIYGTSTKNATRLSFHKNKQGLDVFSKYRDNRN